ncbi:MAG TPA: hypothetical protein VHV81_02865 [Steroidobacteraceae bacterium]|jgi:hypothetical protein|nr:hypothetical protein [Steroidobacteraceae bacterium]
MSSRSVHAGAALVATAAALGLSIAAGAVHAQPSAAHPAPSAGATPAARDIVTAPTRNRGGIWKAATPPVRMQGEFDDLDPLGVAAGVRIEADCSLNWIDPDDGKLYCFSSGTSLEFFLDSPHEHIERARAGWRKLKSPG